MKLEVGQFARTKLGTIGKIENNSCYIKLRLKKGNYIAIEEDDILKTSYNIIDILEEGDYVNGYKVSFKDNDYKPFVQCDYPVQEGTTNHYRFYEEAIYSIVTKEQMEQISYKVG